MVPKEFHSKLLPNSSVHIARYRRINKSKALKFVKFQITFQKPILKVNNMGFNQFVHKQKLQGGRYGLSRVCSNAIWEKGKN